MILHYLENTIGYFLKRGERFLVIEIGDDSLSLSKISVHWQDKKIKILNKWVDGVGWVNDTARAFSFLQKTLKRIPQLAAHKIILILEPRLATTVHVPAKIIRDEGRKVIDEADMDNLISQAVWQVFDRYRAWSADKMSLDDLDVLLVDVKIRNLRIDNHRVLNPLGFPAKTAEVFLSQTFAPRDFFEMIRVLLPQNHFAFIAEAGVIGAEVLARLAPQKSKGIAFVDFTALRSDVYVALSGENCIEKIIYADSFDLGRRDLYANFGKNFLVHAPIAELMMRRYVQGEVSTALAKKVERLVRQEWSLFCDGLASIVADSRDLKSVNNIQVFLHAPERLPELFYAEPIRLRDGRKLELLTVALRDIAAQLGFQIYSPHHQCAFFTTAAIFDLYNYTDGWLNKVANRRLRWLMPGDAQNFTSASTS